MLVGTFEIEVGWVGELVLVRTTQDARMRHAGVEPDIERIAHLAIAGGFVAEQFAGVERKPGFDTGLLNAPGDFFDQFRGARM